MRTCVICKFDVEQDDQIAPTSRGTCICLRCFTRETGTAKSMSKELRLMVQQALVVAA